MSPSHTPALPRGRVQLGQLVDVLHPTPDEALSQTLNAWALLDITRKQLPDAPLQGHDPNPQRARVLRARMRALQLRDDLPWRHVHFLEPPALGEARVLGRADAADVRVQHPTVSKRHAELRRDPRGWLLLDLESQNGTRLEGHRLPAGVVTRLLTCQVLRLGGVEVMLLGPTHLAALIARVRAQRAAALRIDPGGVRLRFLTDHVARTPLDAFLAGCGEPFLLQVPTEANLPSDPLGSISRTLHLSESQVLATPRARDVSDARLFSVPRGDAGAATIGRDPNAEVVLPEQRVSKRHAQLLHDPENRVGQRRFRLMDLESHNGTFLNSERLPAGVATLIPAGATVSFGTYRALFLLPQQLHKLATELANR